MSKKCGPWFLATWHVHSQNVCTAPGVGRGQRSGILAGMVMGSGLGAVVPHGGDMGCKCWALSGQTVGHLKTRRQQHGSCCCQFWTPAFCCALRARQPDCLDAWLPFWRAESQKPWALSHEPWWAAAATAPAVPDDGPCRLHSKKKKKMVLTNKSLGAQRPWRRGTNILISII